MPELEEMIQQRALARFLGCRHQWVMQFARTRKVETLKVGTSRFYHVRGFMDAWNEAHPDAKRDYPPTVPIS
jgi:hypothetical protein